ncbi:MAG: 1-acyl-sn-glycerol-3-phosphate acyltransferase [Chitinophagales bacterium]
MAAYIIKESPHHIYPPILPDIESWPINTLTTEKDSFHEELVSKSIAQIETILDTPVKIHDEIARALYLERMRMKNNPWKVDKRINPDEKSFWNDVHKLLVKTSLDSHSANKETIKKEKELAYTIVSRYATEILGNFNPKTYITASNIITKGFRGLLNTSSKDGRIRERIKITGPIEHIRTLAQKGTVLLVPTHSSNLDSVLIGWSLDAIGLPAFLYGAGLNLFDSRMFSYFMSRLGAYKVDRRKKDTFYIETLKMYSRLTLERGCHSLFFPGGTRARSGQVEKKLKLGLLGTAIDAQRLIVAKNLTKNKGGKGKIFVVPLVLNYHFVLEANSLIEEHLRRSGKEQYYVLKDEFPPAHKLLNFTRKFFNKQSEIILTYTEPMDIFGNKVDENGESLDKAGKPIDISSYFVSDGHFQQDMQRDQEYTRMLGEKIVDAFQTNNTVLSSHLVAFVAFNMLKLKYKKRLDLYGLLRLPEDNRLIDYERFKKTVEKVRDKIKEMSNNNKIQSYTLNGDITRLIQHGIDNLGVYHASKPLKKTADGQSVTSESMNLLLFYHNRLKGYQLEDVI